MLLIRHTWDISEPKKKQDEHHTPTWTPSQTPSLYITTKGTTTTTAWPRWTNRELYEQGLETTSLALYVCFFIMLYKLYYYLFFTQDGCRVIIRPLAPPPLPPPLMTTTKIRGSRRVTSEFLVISWLSPPPRRVKGAEERGEKESKPRVPRFETRPNARYVFIYFASFLLYQWYFIPRCIYGTEKHQRVPFFYRAVILQ